MHLLLGIWLSYPRQARAWLGVPGDTLRVLLKLDSPSQVELRLFGDFGEVDLGSFTPVPRDTLWEIEVPVPQGAEPGLYWLVASAPEGSDTEANAVMLYPRWEDTLVFLQWTDTHIGNSDRELENLLLAVQEANLIKPGFVVMTGDVVEKGQVGDSPTWYRQFLEVCRGLRVPLFTVSGNHDWYNWAYQGESEENYLQIVNPWPNYYFTYSDWFLMIALDTGPDDIYGDLDSYCYGFTPEQLAWMGWVLATHSSYPQKLAMMHGPVIDADDNDDSNRHGNDDFTQMALNYGMSLVLAGHTHEDRLFLADSTWVQGDVEGPLPLPYFIQTRTTCKADTPEAGYRLIVLTPDSVLSWSEDEDGNGLPDAAGSLRVGRLWAEYYYNTDSTACAIVLRNEQPRDFPALTAWPRMKPGIGYQVQGPGQVVRQAPSGLLEVRVFNVPSGGSQVVYVEPAQGALVQDPAPGLKVSGRRVWAYPGKGKRARLAAYDAAGRLVKVLKSGVWEQPFEAELSLKPGVYFLRLEGEVRLSAKALLP